MPISIAAGFVIPKRWDILQISVLEIPVLSSAHSGVKRFNPLAGSIFLVYDRNASLNSSQPVVYFSIKSWSMYFFVLSLFESLLIM